eukprot:163569_1
MEFLLLFTLSLAVCVQLGLTSESDYPFAYVILSILIILPLILFMFHISLEIYKIKTAKSETYNLFSLKQRIKYLILSVMVFYLSSPIIKTNNVNITDQQIEMQQIEMQQIETELTEMKYIETHRRDHDSTTSESESSDPP